MDVVVPSLLHQANLFLKHSSARCLQTIAALGKNGNAIVWVEIGLLLDGMLFAVKSVVYLDDDLLCLSTVFICLELYNQATVSNKALQSNV